MSATLELLTILYVGDLEEARAFYSSAFEWEVTVDIPTYVEYRVAGAARLGLMQQERTAYFLGEDLGGRVPSDGCPRAEVYVSVDDATAVADRLVSLGARCTSALSKRDWGDRVAYFLDHDGYVIAVADQRA